jgi:hypothetical protein
MLPCPLITSKSELRLLFINGIHIFTQFGDTFYGNIQLIGAVDRIVKCRRQ